MKKTGVFIIIFILSNTAFAWNKIKIIGCHLNDTTCYVHLGGAPIGPLECQKNKLLWDASKPNGRSTLALLTAAFMANKEVNLGATACYKNSEYPTFKYTNIKQ